MTNQLPRCEPLDIEARALYAELEQLDHEGEDLAYSLFDEADGPTSAVEYERKKNQILAAQLDIERRLDILFSTGCQE